MTKRSTLLNSSVGLKFVMATTGVLLLLFVLFHLLGNLQIYLGPDKLNAYAQFLEELGALLWVARIGLIVIFITHIVSALKLRARNSAARPESYSATATVKASTASVTMVESGIVVLVFVILHLAHFTFGVLQPQFAELHDKLGREDVYAMVVHGFQNPIYATVYILCLLILGLHLSHGISSVFQTLGLRHRKYSGMIEKAGPAIAWLLALGYVSIPVSVLVGIIK